jgi:hypothetical protein
MQFLFRVLRWAGVGTSILVAAAWVRSYFVSDSVTLVSTGQFPRSTVAMGAQIRGGRLVFYREAAFRGDRRKPSKWWVHHDYDRPTAFDPTQGRNSWVKFDIAGFAMFGSDDSQYASTSTHLRVPMWAPLLFTLPVWIWPLRLLRRAIRRKRGVCVCCAYDLRASSDRCPECGHPIPAKPQPPATAPRTATHPPDAPPVQPPKSKK